MKELNWNNFDFNFNGQQENAFEKLSYALFCSRFNIKYGIFAHENQVGIETEPIDFNDKLIGFQAKYLAPSTTFLSRKNIFIEALVKAKEKNSTLNEVYFYVNKSFRESTKTGSKYPKYIVEIERKAEELGLSIVWQVPSHIEKQLSNTENLSIAKEFFPELVGKWMDASDYEKLLDISRTAIIQVEIAKLKYKFSLDWSKDKILLNKLHTYVDYRNETIAREILSFLNIHVSSAARSKMPSYIAFVIHGLVLTYYPSSYMNDELDMKIENAKQCIYIGFNLAYDALIHTNNYRVAEWGLSIWKYIYRESKRSGYEELTKLVLKQYEELEQTLNRPERDDLGNARELVKIFKDDLETYDLSFPVLPEHIYKLIRESN